MMNKNEQTSAKIYQFPSRPPARREPSPMDNTAPGSVTALRNPQVVFGAWYHQAEIEKDGPSWKN